MTGINGHLSILTLNVNGLNAPIKRHRIETRLKDKTQPYVAYKRLLSLKKTNTGLESKVGKGFSKQMDPINSRSSYTHI
jgi:hypothetical protein